MSFPELVAGSDVVVVCGSGGVGKTTTSAAIAAQAAIHTDRKVLVITVDPARRLADALGLEELGNHATRVPAESLTADGTQPKGQLFAAMLDAKQSWDELVHRHAPDAGTERRIVESPLYRNITGRFVQSHDYIAMERLHELHDSGDYDLIVIDTPPSSHAIDFLDAPARMADFFDSKLLKFLTAPSRSVFTSLSARPFLQIADRMLGQRFLNDITEFFTLLESMRPGFIQRANAVERLLAGERSAFVVVTTLEPAPRSEASRFIAELERRRLRFGALVLNRTLPASLLDDRALAAAGGLASDKATALAGKLDIEGADGTKVARVLSELSANYFRFRELAGHEMEQRSALPASAEVIRTVPWFHDELHDVRGLLLVGENIWT